MPTVRRKSSIRTTRPCVTKVSKSIAWIEKYLIRVQRRMPTMTMPKAIRSFKPHLQRNHHTLGNCCIDDRTITLATHSIKEETVQGKKKRVLIPLSKKDILQTFAHELSHLAYEEHGYEQEWYGKTIFNTFGLSEPCPYCKGKGKVPARYENT